MYVYNVGNKVKHLTNLTIYMTFMIFAEYFLVNLENTLIISGTLEVIVGNTASGVAPNSGTRTLAEVTFLKFFNTE